jgi:hypothetical protein
MGHQKWVIINNDTTDFNTKIKNAKEKAHFILGHNQIAGSSFYKKFLLKKTSVESFGLLTPVRGSNSSESQVPVKLTKIQQ